METLEEKKVLISGASFAGLSTAYWMNQLGYKVTVVEVADGLKRGGTPVNIQGKTVNIVKRMGVFEQIEANRLHMELMAFKNADDSTAGSLSLKKDGMEADDESFEIERDVLLNILFDKVKSDVDFVFGDRITSLTEIDDELAVTFKNGTKRSFDLVFGCDGLHSAVRRLWFGPEANYMHFLKAYFSITIVPEMLISENTTQMYNEPGRAVMLNAYHNKTDIVLCFFSETEIPYDYRNQEQQRKIILNEFTGRGWKTEELLGKVRESATFYFDKLCQIKMPSWTKGRVALVGDAGYCASPAAGMGGSLAIDGAAALADAFGKNNGDFEPAFRDYNQDFRPFIEEVQDAAVKFGLEMLVPKTEGAISIRNMQTEF